MRKNSKAFLIKILHEIIIFKKLLCSPPHWPLQQSTPCGCTWHAAHHGDGDVLQACAWTNSAASARSGGRCSRGQRWSPSTTTLQLRPDSGNLQIKIWIKNLIFSSQKFQSRIKQNVKKLFHSWELLGKGIFSCVNLYLSFMTGENVTIIFAEKTTSRFHQMQYKKSFKSQMVRMKKVAKRKTHKKL